MSNDNKAIDMDVDDGLQMNLSRRESPVTLLSLVPHNNGSIAFITLTSNAAIYLALDDPQK